MHKGLIWFFVALACIDAVLGDCSGPHESVRCVSCPERTCADRNVPNNCQPSNSCTYKCVCDDEFYRSSSGDCLSYQECNYYP